MVEFPFPFPPYEIQKDFMAALYETIESKRIGIFESPTGTGKSLSLICGAMKWLQDYNSKSEEELIEEEMKKYLANEGSTKLPKWLLDQTRNRARAKIAESIRSKKEELNKRKEYLKNLRLKPNKNSFKKTKRNVEELVDENLLIDDYDSDQEQKELDSAVQILESDKPKIIYTSRTHSQISQFIHEISKTKYDHSSVVALGSRKNLCIHERISKLSSIARINDECKDLNKKAGSCCKFKRTDKEEESQLFADFTDETHSVIRDIEDLALLGKKMAICPYYGARKAVAGAEVVCVPYNLLLHKATRITSNINLKNSIVIVDEAHNLIDSINSIHSIFVESAQIQLSLTQLKNYYEKYKVRLSAKNSMYIKQLLLVLSKLNSTFSKTGLMTALEFVQLLELEHLNFFKLIQFLESSQLANKLQGFNDKNAIAVKVGNEDSYVPKNESPIRNIASLLEVLAYPDEDGRILLSSDENKVIVKYLLLNPSNVFEDIITEARSVILAGGTMEPISDFLAQLLPKVSSQRIKTFGCGHVISNSQLLPLVISSNEKCEFQFGYEKRNNIEMVIQTGLTICKLATCVPGGVVVFAPSYKYLEFIFGIWGANGITAKIREVKELFKEQPSAATESMLLKYSEACANLSGNGAILFAVVGGKLSEGINFSDDMGRMVIMIGLPYPNKQSLELQERMKYLDSHSNLKGSEYYENLCMRAVNQCIGRVIRHQKDYACIVLLDLRYNSTRIQQKLPKWILKCGLRSSTGVIPIGDIKLFYAQRRNQR